MKSSKRLSILHNISKRYLEENKLVLLLYNYKDTGLVFACRFHPHRPLIRSILSKCTKYLPTRLQVNCMAAYVMWFDFLVLSV